MKLSSIRLIPAILLGLFASAGFSSCSDDKNDGPDGNTEFRLSAEDCVFTQDGGEKEITVQCSGRPAATADASWLTISQPVAVGSKGNLYRFTLTAPAYAESDSRTASVTVKAGSATGTVKVTQNGTGFKVIEDNVSTASIAPFGDNATIVLQAKEAPVLSGSASWILAKAEETETGKYTIRVRPAVNAGSVREGTLDIKVGSNSLTVPVKQAAYVPAGSGDMSSDARRLAARIYAGVNIGNTMEVPGGETGWGNPAVSLNYIKGLKQLGFNAVRIPCAWDSHVADAEANIIDPEWLDRVAEVVDWVVAEGMYAMVNIHWDGGWLENDCPNGYNADVDKKQRDYWTQIAVRLNGFDEHLLLAGMNEPNHKGDKSVEAIMKYQQTFSDAVRATGGNNATRVLIHQGPGTDITATVTTRYALPADAATGRQMVEIHMYDPSDFTILEKGKKEGNADAWSDYAKYYWGEGNLIPGSVRNSTWGNAADIENAIRKMNTSFVSKGIPVIMGEYSAMDRSATSADIDMERFKASRTAWNTFVTRTAKNYGCVPFYWETGGDIVRSNGTARNQYAIDAVMQGASEGTYPF